MIRYVFWLLFLALGGTALAQPISSDNAVIPGGTGLTVGNPTGGAPGPGNINIQGQILINGAPVSGTGTVTSVTAGTGLGGGTITGIGTVYLLPTAVTPGSYTAANITVNAQGQITAAANGSSGGSVTWPTTGQIVVSNGTNTPASVAYGLTGISTIVETTSGGLLTASIIPQINLATGVTGSLPLANIAQGGAATNQVLTWNGSAWAGATPSSGGNVSNAGTPTNGQIALWTGATTIQGASTLPLSDLAQGGATTNQVIQWNGSAWVPGTVSGGSGCATTGCTYTGLINTVGITDTVTPNGTNGISTTGTLTFGGAPIQNGGSSGGVINNQVSYSEATTAAIRNRMFVDTVTNNTGSSQIDEGFFLARTFGGTGTYSTEINGYHVVFNDVATATFTNSMENIETSTYYQAAHNSTTSVDALQHYATTGTNTGVVQMFTAGLTNDNTTAGSIGTYNAFVCGVPGGTGSVPAHDYCLLDQDPLGAIVDYANMTIGSTGAIGAATKLYVRGTAVSSSPVVPATTNEAQFVSTAGTSILTIGDTGLVTFGGTISAASLGTGTQVSCLGLTAGNLIVPSTGGCGTGSGTGITVTDSTTSVSSATTLTFGSGFVTNLGSNNAEYTGITILTYTATASAALPANAKLVRFIAQGQGGCGGGGAGITTPFTGAGGGGGGGSFPKDSGWFPASLVSGNYTVNIGTPCTAAAGGTAGGNGANGSSGARAQVSMTGMDTLVSFEGGGGAGAVGGSGDTATGGGGGAGTYSQGSASTTATGGAGGANNGGTGGSGTFPGQSTLYGGATGGSGSAATGTGALARASISGSSGGASGGGCNTGTPAAGGAGASPGNANSVSGGTAGGATGGNGATGFGSSGVGGLVGATGGSGGGGGTTTGGNGGNGGLAGGGGGGGGSGCGASATGGNGGVGGGPQVIVMVQ